MSNSSIKPFVRGLATAFQQGYDFQRDKARVVFTDVDKKISEALGDKLSMDQLIFAQDVMIDITAAHTLAVGEVGETELKAKDAPLKITAKTNFGHSAVETTYHKEQTGNAAGKPYRNVGKAQSDLIIGVGRNAASYKEVQKHLAANAELVFAN